MVGRVFGGAINWFNKAMEDAITYLLTVGRGRQPHEEPEVAPEVVAAGKAKASLMRSSRLVKATYITVPAGPGFGAFKALYLLEDNIPHGFRMGETIQAITATQCPGKDLLEYESKPFVFRVMRYLSGRDQIRLERGQEPESEVIEIVGVQRL